ncbi:MAG: helix-turn-helix transcriptional regulator [Chitinophagales bacterium]|nr:helix-turn-helix transcriptional regulator [Chitinophagales bacterium]
MTEKTIHEGRNVKRIREILGVKQDVLALELGISQQAISALEQKEALDKDMLEKIGKALKVSPDAIRSFQEEAVINNISCTFHDFHDNSSVFQFNPVDKIIELYDKLLKEKDEKIALLEKMLNKQNR